MKQMKKDLRTLSRALTSQGFTTRMSSKGHLVVSRSGHTVAVLAGTPSDCRSMRNSLADLRRAGFVCS